MARLRGPREGGEAGFGIAEVLAASLILMVVVISLSNLLVDSLSAALLSKQREQAASLASDMVENAKALGQVQLSEAPSGSTPCTVVASGTSVPIRTYATFQQCFTATVDNTTYTVIPTVTVSTSAPDGVTISVTWGASRHLYLTSSLVGTGQSGT